MTSGPSRAFDDGPAGYSYAAVLVRVGGVPSGQPAGPPPGQAPGQAAGREQVLDRLRVARFSGWVGPVEGGWLVAVAGHPGGTVASGRRGVIDLGAWLAGQLATTVVAVRVVDDRQLALAVWTGTDEVGRYLSDPSYHGDEDLLSDPLGAEHAEAFAEACGRPDAGEQLGELLAEEIDPDSMIESERLSRVLRLLRLPPWVVAAASLPRDVPSGPRARDLTRLGAGRTGPLGRLAGSAADVLRRRRPPAPAFPDAPRAEVGDDPWLY